jgi:hypothetical protein
VLVAGVGNGEWKSHSGDLGVTSDVKMVIRERIVVTYLDGIRLSGLGPVVGCCEQDVVPKGLLCSVVCGTRIKHSQYSRLLSALSFGRVCEAFLVALLWTDCPLTSTSLSHRPFLQLSHCPANACESQLIIGPQIAG